MFQTIKSLFTGPQANFKELFGNGAQIVDVRSKAEYNSGHVKGAINIPLDQLQTGMSKLKKDKPVITCCASGVRSAAAKNLLESKGFAEVYNGGGWSGLEAKLKG